VDPPLSETVASTRRARRIDEQGCCREAAVSDDLGEQAAEGLPDDGRPLGEAFDDGRVVVCDLADRLATSALDGKPLERYGAGDTEFVEEA
jgi:hypothetical protein